MAIEDNKFMNANDYMASRREVERQKVLAYCDGLMKDLRGLTSPEAFVLKGICMGVKMGYNDASLDEVTRACRNML